MIEDSLHIIVVESFQWIDLFHGFINSSSDTSFVSISLSASFMSLEYEIGNQGHMIYQM